MPRTKQARCILPPGVRPAVLAGVPKQYRREAVQEAWVAHLEGDDPERRVWRWFRRLRRHEARFTCFSQLGPEALRALGLEATE